jgi:hypothetical protein
MEAHRSRSAAWSPPANAHDELGGGHDCLGRALTRMGRARVCGLPSDVREQQDTHEPTTLVSNGDGNSAGDPGWNGALWNRLTPLIWTSRWIRSSYLCHAQVSKGDMGLQQALTTCGYYLPPGGGRPPRKGCFQQHAGRWTAPHEGSGWALVQKRAWRVSPSSPLSPLLSLCRSRAARAPWPLPSCTAEGAALTRTNYVRSRASRLVSFNQLHVRSREPHGSREHYLHVHPQRMELVGSGYYLGIISWARLTGEQRVLLAWGVCRAREHSVPSVPSDLRYMYRTYDS